MLSFGQSPFLIVGLIVNALLRGNVLLPAILNIIISPTLDYVLLTLILDCIASETDTVKSLVLQLI